MTNEKATLDQRKPPPPETEKKPAGPSDSSSLRASQACSILHDRSASAKGPVRAGSDVPCGGDPALEGSSSSPPVGLGPASWCRRPLLELTCVSASLKAQVNPDTAQVRGPGVPILFSCSHLSHLLRRREAFSGHREECGGPRPFDPLYSEALKKGQFPPLGSGEVTIRP